MNALGSASFVDYEAGCRYRELYRTTITGFHHQLFPNFSRTSRICAREPTAARVDSCVDRHPHRTRPVEVRVDCQQHFAIVEYPGPWHYRMNRVVHHLRYAEMHAIS